jgi:hypothetical protein
MIVKFFKRLLFFYYFSHEIYSIDWVTPGPGDWLNPAN